MPAHEPFLYYRRFRYLKVTLGVLTATLFVAPLPRLYQRTAVVYGLGIVSALLIVWLIAFSYRKRRYSTTAAPLRGWLSAHVYLGVLPLVLVPVHASFRFGPNVHTLAFLLMAAVILSGILWAAFYTTLPAELTRNRPGGKLVDLLQEIATVEAKCRALRANLPERLADEVDAALTTRMGGALWRQLAGYRHDASRRALAALRADRTADTEAVDRLLPLLGWVITQ